MSETVDLATLAVRAKPEGIDDTRQQLAKLGDQAAKTEQSTGKLAVSTESLIGKYLSFAAVGATAVAVAVNGIREFGRLESATANLAAKTGLAGAEIEYMKNRALELSEASTKTAVEILNAAEQIEGLIPSLNGNAEAIAEVTRQAVLLSEATGDDLKSSVFAVGQAMEQFGGKTIDAARFVNVMVAAAQNGAAEVQDLAGAMERVGPAAVRAGVNFEQSAAAIEILANKGIRGREGVEGLRTVFDKLATSTDSNLNPAIVGINAALANLGDMNLTAAQRTKLFGQAGDDLAKTLIENRNQFGDLTVKMTGTTAALDQAKERMDTIDSRAKAMQNALSNASSAIGDALSPLVIGLSTDLLTLARAFGEATRAQHDSESASEGMSIGLKQVGGALFATGQSAHLLYVSLADIFSLDFKKLGADWEAMSKRAQMFDKSVFAIADDALTGGAKNPTRGSGRGGAGAGPGHADMAAAVAAEIAQAEQEAALAASRAGEEARAKDAQDAFQRHMAMLQDQSNTALAQMADSIQAEGDLEAELRQGLADYGIEAAVEAEIVRQERLTEIRREFADTDLVAELAYIDEREAAINEYFDSLVIPNEQERNNRLLEIHRQREASIGHSARRGVISRTEFEKLTEKDRKQYLQATGEEILATLAQHNKAAFKLHQAVGIAKAVVSTAQGVTKVLGDYGWPLGPVFAALLLAQGAAQIATIKSQSFDGGSGSVSSGGGGGGGASVSVPSVGEATQPLTPGLAQGAGTQLQIIIAGNSFLDDGGVERLTDRIRDAVDRRDLKLFGDDSRQAQDVQVIRR